MQNANKTRGVGPLGGSGMVGLWGASSLIKSRQSGFCTLGNASSIGNTTITAVDMANTIVLYNGWYHNITNGSRPRDSWARVSLQSATNVRALMDFNGAGLDGVLYFTVVEFWPGVIKSIQRGTLTVTAGNAAAAAALTGVNLAKTFLNWQGFQYSGTEAYNTTDPKNWLAYSSINTSTQLTLARPGTSNDMSISYEVVELF